jgi:hypothetical protein
MGYWQSIQLLDQRNKTQIHPFNNPLNQQEIHIKKGADCKIDEIEHVVVPSYLSACSASLAE